MKPATYVRILRLRSSGCGKAPRLITESGVQFVPIQNGDWIEGRLVRPIRIGKPIEMRCLFYNGELCNRTYVSSKVETITSDLVRTAFVVYKVLRVPKFDSKKSLRAWE
jgi:hypothetical protein